MKKLLTTPTTLYTGLRRLLRVCRQYGRKAWGVSVYSHAILKMAEGLSPLTPAMPMTPVIPDVGGRTRGRIAWRLLPFVFLLYLVAYLDRANVSFAALKMNLDLGFSDRVYGLGVAMFFVGYVVFEVPGAIIVERWSARKWTARIMISWGLATILSGLVHRPGQFYAARFFLGMA